MITALALLVGTAVAPQAPALAFLEGIGAMEMMLVAVIGLLLFGGKGLPDMARTMGRVIREFKKASASVEQEVKRVMDEEPETRRRPPKPNRQSLIDNNSTPDAPLAPGAAPSPAPTPSRPAPARDMPPPSSGPSS